MVVTSLLAIQLGGLRRSLVRLAANLGGWPGLAAGLADEIGTVSTTAAATSQPCSKEGIT
jgi:hypothetical protein